MIVSSLHLTSDNGTYVTSSKPHLAGPLTLSWTMVVLYESSDLAVRLYEAILSLPIVAVQSAFLY